MSRIYSMLWLGVWLSLLGGEVYAADGASNGLMNVPSAGILAPGNVEFAPTFQFGWSGYQLDANGHVGPRPGEHYDSQSNVRLTVGILPRWELGLQVPLLGRWDNGNAAFLVERLSLANKLLLYRHPSQKFQLAAFVGLQFPMMARTWVADGGLVFDFNPTSWLSFNVSGAAFVDWLISATPGIRADVGAGVYVWRRWLQLVVEWSEVLTAPGSPSASILGTLGVGFNLYVHSAVTVLVGGIFDFHGTNQPQNFQLVIGLTFALDLRDAG